MQDLPDFTVLAASVLRTRPYRGGYAPLHGGSQVCSEAAEQA